jgi:hypothetical protein
LCKQGVQALLASGKPFFVSNSRLANAAKLGDEAVQELEAVVERVCACAPYLKVQFVTPRGHAIKQLEYGKRLMDEYGRNPNRHAEEVSTES